METRTFFTSFKCETNHCSCYCNKLLIKVEDPQSLGEVKPISLDKCMNKIVAKVLANILKKVLGEVIHSRQSALS